MQPQEMELLSVRNMKSEVPDILPIVCVDINV